MDAGGGGGYRAPPRGQRPWPPTASCRAPPHALSTHRSIAQAGQLRQGSACRPAAPITGLVGSARPCPGLRPHPAPPAGAETGHPSSEPGSDVSPLCQITSSSSCFCRFGHTSWSPAGRTQGRAAGEGHPCPAFPEPASAPPARTRGFREAPSPHPGPRSGGGRCSPGDAGWSHPGVGPGMTRLDEHFWDPVSWGERP